jgi:hypothetical protein
VLPNKQRLWIVLPGAVAAAAAAGTALLLMAVLPAAVVTAAVAAAGNAILLIAVLHVAVLVAAVAAAGTAVLLIHVLPVAVLVVATATSGTAVLLVLVLHVAVHVAAVAAAATAVLLMSALPAAVLAAAAAAALLMAVWMLAVLPVAVLVAAIATALTAVLLITATDNWWQQPEDQPRATSGHSSVNMSCKHNTAAYDIRHRTWHRTCRITGGRFRPASCCTVPEHCDPLLVFAATCFYWKGPKQSHPLLHQATTIPFSLTPSNLLLRTSLAQTSTHLVGHTVSLARIGRVWAVKGQIGHMAGVQAGKPVDLVAISTVLIASLEQLTPDRVEGFMVGPVGFEKEGGGGAAACFHSWLEMTGLVHIASPKLGGFHATYEQA